MCVCAWVGGGWRGAGGRPGGGITVWVGLGWWVGVWGGDSRRRAWPWGQKQEYQREAGIEGG